MAFICIKLDVDYAANGCVYQPESKEAIFNSLGKKKHKHTHTLWEDFFQRRLYITQGTLLHDLHAEELS